MAATLTVNDENVHRHVERWRGRVARRLRAGDDNRPPWDRERFLLELWDDCPDYPGAVELADAFQAAYEAALAQGNWSRFECELNRRGVTPTA